MGELIFSVLVDGPSDRALVPIIEWALREVGCLFPATGQVITPSILRRLAPNPKKLDEKIVIAIQYFPCDLLIVHRDAEREPHEFRIDEIEKAIVQAGMTLDLPRTVPVVPVRMHEAWLLFSEEAVRTASGNPNGAATLQMPPLRSCESLPDPKDYLDDLLERASGLSGTRLKRFDRAAARSRVVDLIDDFSPLKELSAFDAFLQTLRETLQYSGWV